MVTVAITILVHVRVSGLDYCSCLDLILLPAAQPALPAPPPPHAKLLSARRMPWHLPFSLCRESCTENFPSALPALGHTQLPRGHLPPHPRHRATCHSPARFMDLFLSLFPLGCFSISQSLRSFLFVPRAPRAHQDLASHCLSPTGLVSSHHLTERAPCVGDWSCESSSAAPGSLHVAGHTCVFLADWTPGSPARLPPAGRLGRDGKRGVVPAE